MYHSEKKLLKHILDKVNYILTATKGKNVQVFLYDETLKRTVPELKQQIKYLLL